MVPFDTAGADLARHLAQIVSEVIFDIPRLVEAERHQRLDSISGSGPTERIDARIPSGACRAIRTCSVVGGATIVAIGFSFAFVRLRNSTD